MPVGFVKHDLSRSNSYKIISEREAINSANIRHGYYDLIVRFDDEHANFLNFSQSLLSITIEPNEEKIFELYDMYMKPVIRSHANASIEQIDDSIKSLEELKFYKTGSKKKKGFFDY